MGSNSNRTTKSEKVSGYVRSIMDQKRELTSEFQYSTGAEIRGKMGVDKGNAFIKAIQDANR